jgi:hypothetical protein
MSRDYLATSVLTRVSLFIIISAHTGPGRFLQVNYLISLPAYEECVAAGVHRDHTAKLRFTAVKTGSCCWTPRHQLSWSTRSGVALRNDVGSAQYFIQRQLCCQKDVEVSHEQWLAMAYKRY